MRKRLYRFTLNCHSWEHKGKIILQPSTRKNHALNYRQGLEKVTPVNSFHNLYGGQRNEESTLCFYSSHWYCKGRAGQPDLGRQLLLVRLHLRRMCPTCKYQAETVLTTFLTFTNCWWGQCQKRESMIVSHVWENTLGLLWLWGRRHCATLTYALAHAWFWWGVS